MCFTKPEWKFLNDKHHEVSNFYGLPKIHKSKITESTINTKKSEVIEIFEPNDLKLRPIVGVRRFPTWTLSQLIDILLKPFLKHIKRSIPFIRQGIFWKNLTLGVVKVFQTVLESLAPRNQINQVLPEIPNDGWI